jgi:hypothetical protein
VDGLFSESDRAGEHGAFQTLATSCPGIFAQSRKVEPVADAPLVIPTRNFVEVYLNDNCERVQMEGIDRGSAYAKATDVTLIARMGERVCGMRPTKG